MAIEILSGIDWSTLASGVLVGAVTMAGRTIIQAPVKAMTEQSAVIRLLWFLSPQKPFSGKWEVTWRVESTRFEDANTDIVKIRRLFSNVSFQTISTLKDGSTESCVFVGKMLDRVITGRWFNPADKDRAYYGNYQIKLHGSMRRATGSWMGWQDDGTIQTHELTLKRVD